MALLKRKMAITAKIETTVGTDAAPTLAANAILVKNVDWTPMEMELASRDLMMPYLGNPQSIAVAVFGRMSYEVEIAGSWHRRHGPQVRPAAARLWPGRSCLGRREGELYAGVFWLRGGQPVLLSGWRAAQVSVDPRFGGLRVLGQGHPGHEVRVHRPVCAGGRWCAGGCHLRPDRSRPCQQGQHHAEPARRQPGARRA